MFHDVVALGYAALLAKNQRVGKMVCILYSSAIHAVLPFARGEP